MIFAWILISLLTILSGFLIYVIYQMAEQADEYENNIDFFKQWYDKFITIIADADNKLAEVDKRGSFSSDDEIGFAYKTIQECINNLTEMGAITYERETDSREEVQGQEEEE